MLFKFDKSYGSFEAGKIYNLTDNELRRLRKFGVPQYPKKIEHHAEIVETVKKKDDVKDTQFKKD